MKEIQKNSREVIRIGESEYEGHKFVDCRIYYDNNGEWLPSPRGISLGENTALEFVEGILQKIEEKNWNEFETN